MKKIVLALVVVVAAMFAQADFLYWQIANNTTTGNPTSFTTATLWADNGTAKSQVETVFAQGVNTSSDSTMTGTTTGLVQSDITDYASDTYSFFVELATYSSDGTVQSESWLDMFTYDNLVSKGYVSAGSVTVPSYAVSGGLNMNAGGTSIPEPTSGLLFLLGGAVMALRRRRRA